mgnify:CR=1 FL=1
MEDQHSIPFLRETILFLALAGILIPVLQRLRVNQVLGFLAAGLLLGPFGLGLWTDQWPWLETFTFPQREGVSVLAELGVLFLMFMIGLELSAERLWAMRRWVFGIGGLQVIVSAVLIGGLALGFGHRWESALVLGLVLSLSSTAVVMQLLTHTQSLGTPVGQATFSVLMLQDLAVVPVLILIGVLGAEGDVDVWSLLGSSILKSVAAVLLIMVVGGRLIRPLFRTLAKQRQPEVLMALTLLATMSIASITAYAGLSMALGAFLAGLLLAETEYRHEVEVTIEPFKGLLMGLFFMSVGMAIDAREVMQAPVWLALSVLGLILIKAAVVTVLFRLGGLSWGQALEGGLLLGQGGEFAFIVVAVAATSGVLDGEAAQFMLLVVSLSLFVTPLVARLGRDLGAMLDARKGPVLDMADDTSRVPDAVGHVVLAGFGRVGRLIADVLVDQKVNFIALEHQAERVHRMRRHYPQLFVGNAAHGALLRHIHVAQASVVVLTMDQPHAALQAVKAVRQVSATLPIVARSRDELHAKQLREAGASMVIPETVEAGLQVSAFVLQALGVADAQVHQVLDRERQARITALNDHSL